MRLGILAEGFAAFVTASLIEGPLASTCATLAKVSTSPKDESHNHQHDMCLYMPDVYDQDKVTEVTSAYIEGRCNDIDCDPGDESLAPQSRNESHGCKIEPVHRNWYVLTSVGA